MSPIPSYYIPKKGGRRHREAFQRWVSRLPADDPRRQQLIQTIPEGSTKWVVLQQDRERRQLQRQRQVETKDRALQKKLEDLTEYEAIQKKCLDMSKILKLPITPKRLFPEKDVISKILDEMRLPDLITELEEDKYRAPIPMEVEVQVKSWRDDPRYRQENSDVLELHIDEDFMLE